MYLYIYRHTQTKLFCIYTESLALLFFVRKPSKGVHFFLFDRLLHLSFMLFCFSFLF